MGGAVTSVPVFTPNGWFAILCLGTMGGAIQFALFTWALRWLPPSSVVSYLTLNPISAIFLAAMLLGEAITSFLILGFALVLSGIFLANRPRTTVVSTKGIEETQGSGAPNSINESM